MNLSKQIKKYRESAGFSQEELAERIFVSRQTISNWENERSYPDVHNLLLLSVLFDTTLDELVKGDVEMMKKTVKRAEEDKDTYGMLIFLVLAMLTVGPLTAFFGQKGLILPGILWLIGMYYALKVERWKKREDVRTYREIVAYMENGDVEAARAKRNKVKDFLAKAVIVLVFALVAGLLAWLGHLPFSF